MRTLLTLCVVLFLGAGLVCAAGIDGKWVSEQKLAPPGGGEERTIVTTFLFKAEGDKLTGTVTTPGMGGGEPRSIEIQEGKIEGNNISFFTVIETQRGTFKTKYTATLEGDVLKGKREREGGGGGGRFGSGEFVAKRQ